MEHINDYQPAEIDAAWMAANANDYMQPFHSLLRQSFSLHEIMEERPPRQWLVPGLLASPSLNVFFGQPGAGKSMILADLAMALISGRTWLPYQSGNGGIKLRQGKVLWVDVDNGKRRTLDRFKAFATSYGVTPDLADRLTVISMPSVEVLADPYTTQTQSVPLHLTHPGAVAALRGAIMWHKPDLVVIDTLVDMFGPTDENTGQVISVLQELRKMTEMDIHSCAMVLTHHPRKTNDAALSLNDMRGFSGIAGKLDGSFAVEKTDAGATTLRSVKDRDTPTRPLHVELRTQVESNELKGARFVSVGAPA